ncbi:MAG: phosphotransferase [Paludibacteraceae bacterium]|nr:phosphotransferase [Paludibacteraceae bacterium]
MRTQMLANLFKSIIGKEPEAIIPISGSGSNRRYYRLQCSPNISYIGVEGTSVEENKAFLYMADHFMKLGLPVPKVVAQSKDFRYYLQQDLGDTSLFDIIKQRNAQGELSEYQLCLLEKTVRQLAHIQTEGNRGFDYSVCYPQPEFDRRTVMWDINYFKYCFLKATQTDFLENQLEDDFEHLADCLTKDTIVGFMYRDCQARNIMVFNGEPYFIDFQGGRKGPVLYDIASFLWQAKANYPQEVRERLLSVYFDELQSLNLHSKVGPHSDAGPHSDSGQNLKQSLPYFVLFRTLQVLGAYGFRGYFERKSHFLESIPFAISNLRKLLQNNDFAEIPYLKKVLEAMVNQPFLDNSYLQKTEPTEPSRLCVRVFSFSFKKGLPQDESGNGGGFVFDCRAIHNPGKYAEYKSLTGKDEPVIRFLENDGEILTFLQSVYALVDKSVARYLERGFTDLMVSFGCTGGQHRSVYAAEHLAGHLKDKFNVNVVLKHLAQ